MKPEIFTDFKECGDYKLGWNDHNQAMNEWLASDEVKEKMFWSIRLGKDYPCCECKDKIMVDGEIDCCCNEVEEWIKNKAKAIQEELVKEVKE